MDLVPLHPKLVHLPIALAVVVPLVATAVLVAWGRGWFHRRTWLMVVGLQALLVLGGLAALQTGEADEERVERIVSESLIEAHEEAAEAFLWAGGVVLALMVGATVLRQERAAKVAAGLATAGTAVVLVLGYLVGQAGGELVYRHNAAAAYAVAAPRVTSGHAGAGSVPGAGTTPAASARPAGDDDDDDDGDDPHGDDDDD